MTSDFKKALELCKNFRKFANEKFNDNDLFKKVIIEINKIDLDNFNKTGRWNLSISGIIIQFLNLNYVNGSIIKACEDLIKLYEYYYK